MKLLEGPTVWLYFVLREDRIKTLELVLAKNNTKFNDIWLRNRNFRKDFFNFFPQPISVGCSGLMICNVYEMTSYHDLENINQPIIV